MNKALIYRPNNRKLIWFAFACAVTIHLGAVAIAGNKSKAVAITSWGGSDGPPIEVEDPPTTEIETIVPPELPPVENQEFTEQDVTRPIHPRTKAPVAAVPGSTGLGAARSVGFASAKALTLFAPKPNYPYEARRSGTIGTGIVHLTVNSAAGSVIDARMSQSTGSAILDNATLGTLKRWRFKPGFAENVDVPITYTLAGVSY